MLFNFVQNAGVEMNPRRVQEENRHFERKKSSVFPFLTEFGFEINQDS